jgi:hypothetical protein
MSIDNPLPCISIKAIFFTSKGKYMHQYPHFWFEPVCLTQQATTICCGQWIAFNRRHFFGLSLVDDDGNNVGQQIKVHYLTTAGGFNP